MKTLTFKLAIISAVLLMLAGVAFSCKDKEKTIHLEMGLYVESNPIKGRTKITFVDEKTLTLQKGFYDEPNDTIIYDGYEEMTFEYKIEDNRIELTNEGITTHYFRAINSKKFETGYLYPNKMDAIFPNMVFEKI